MTTEEQCKKFLIRRAVEQQNSRSLDFAQDDKSFEALRHPKSDARLHGRLLARRFLLRFVDSFPADYGAQHFGSQDFRRGHRGDVAIEDHEVRQHARRQRSLVILSEFSER
jgi:hypothetical protein